MKTERWNQIAARANTCSAVSSGMVEELLVYAESLRMAVETAFREGINEGLDRDEIPESEREQLIDAVWSRSKANEVIHPDEG